MPISVACDICGKAFGAQPDNIIPCYTLDDWQQYTEPGVEPSQYVFVCQVCEPQVVHFYESDD